METALVKLKNSDEFAILDAEDFERVFAVEWYIHKDRKRNFIAARRINGEKRVLLSHFVLRYAHSDQTGRVRFINGNKFDFRKSNLEFSYQARSKFSIYYHKPSTGKKPSPSAWRVVIYLPFKQREVILGYYYSEEYAQKIIEYLEKNEIVISSDDDLKSVRSTLRNYAKGNGYGSLFSSGSGAEGRNRGRPIESKIGDETVRGGSIFVKTEEGWRGWRSKHRLIWEQHNGQIPKNHVIHFKDGNRLNCKLENLEMISYQESMFRRKLLDYPEEFHPTLRSLWQLNCEIKHINDSQPKKRQKLRDLFSVMVCFFKHTKGSNNPQWLVDIYCPSIHRSGFYIGRYRTREIAQEIKSFIQNSNFTIKTREDIENVKSLVRNFAVEKGYSQFSK